MPMANSISMSRRRTTAMTHTATVTQNSTNGNQPETIEKLSASMVAPSFVDQWGSTSS